MKTVKIWQAMIAVLLCSFTTSAQTFEKNGISYAITSSTELTVKVTEKNIKYSGTVEIPAKVSYDDNEYSVTEIGDYAFSSCSSLTSITIPESVSKIGYNAFSSCRGLTSITIPEGVERISDGAFSECSSLETVIIPKSVTLIGEWAFYGSTGELIMKCDIPSNFSSRGGFANSNFTRIIFEEGVTTIRDACFYECKSLTSITIPKSVTSIESGTFQNCPGELIVNCDIPSEAFKSAQFTEVTIGDGVNTIGSWAFCDCESLISLNIPESVTEIGDNAFQGCNSLTSLNIPEGVTSIGESAFSSCSSLEYTFIPQSVTYIGAHAFYGCTGILTLECDIPSLPDNLIGQFSDSKFTQVIIGEQTTTIGNYAFKGNKNLTSIVISQGVTSIGVDAFCGCSGLTSITIPQSVTSIGQSAFEGCSGLVSIFIPGNVEEIGNFAFNHCNLKTVFWEGGTLPNGYNRVKALICYTSNSDYASEEGFKVYPMLGSMFEVDGVKYVPTSMSDRTCDVVDYDCNRTEESVEIGATVSFRDVAFTVNKINDYTFYGHKYVKEISLGNHGIIGAHALANCTELTSVNLVEGVTSIGEYAFNGCNKLSSFVLPASASSIGNSMLANCNVLASISVAEGNTMYDSRDNCNGIIETETNKLVAACNLTMIPESVTAIGDYAFSGCGEMTSITIHENISSIGDYSFSGCSSLADITIEDRTEVLTLGSNGNKGLFADCPLESVNIGGKISYNTSPSNGYSPFCNNASLRTVTITDKEETIYPYEFYNCSALKNVTIGEGLTSIGDYAFSGCSSLEEFTFGCSMKTIGANAFLGCCNIKSFSSGAVNPPVCGENALNDLDKWNCTLYMPVDYKAVYQAADQWKEFLYMEDNVPIKQYTLTYIVDGNVYLSNKFAYGQTIVLPDTPTKEGYSFDSWIGLPETMPVSDITVHASFTINEYTLIYKVDDVEYKTESVPYGTKIIALAAPTKEGHTFSGWNELPETMPAKDVTITGSFSVNNYLLTYIIDGFTYQSYLVAYGTAIAMQDAPAKLGYTFDGWDKTLAVMPAEDVVVYGSYTRLPIENFVITDGSEAQFLLEENLQCNAITYTRNFTNTYWQSLYVPFEIPITEELLAEFEIADLNDIRQYDRDDDGVKDETVVEAFKVKSGATLAANYPYLIRAKVAGEKTITVTDATLFATEEVSIDCSSIHEKYTFTGTYSTMESSELTGCYALCDGVWQPIAEDATLGAFRVYLKIESRDNNTTPAQAIRVRVIGEDEEDGATAIDVMESTDNSQQSTVIYDLMGRRVANSDKGIYIVNGRKVVVK